MDASLYLLSLLLFSLSIIPPRVECLTILIEGRTLLPQSYAIVNCFQILGLYSVDNSITIYLNELSSQFSNVTVKQSLFSDEYAEILSSRLKPWNGESVDVVYRISFPLELEYQFIANYKVPVVLFYAATYSMFTNCEVNYNNTKWNSKNYMNIADSTALYQVIDRYSSDVYFVSPSPGASYAFQRIMSKKRFENQHRIIPHGVDTSIFYPLRDRRLREETRSSYKVSAEDILLLNVGSLTANKGVDLMLLLLYEAGINSRYKLMLKGLDDLFSSFELLETRVDILVDHGVVDVDLITEIIRRKVIFLGSRISFQQLNALYNAADAYLSLYASEAFNLPVLEAIAVGLPVFVSRNGSSTYYIDHILESVGGSHERMFCIPDIYMFIDHQQFRHRLMPKEFLKYLEERLHFLQRPLSKYYQSSLQSFLFDHYSWHTIGQRLLYLFREAISS